MTATIDLNNKLTPPDRIAEMALDDNTLLLELLQGISPDSQKAARRENCSQAILHMAEVWPEMLLPHWEYFFNLLKSSNGSSKYVAVYVIAWLSRIDKAGLFEAAFDDYFALLDDESIMVASHTALNAARIALAQPALRERIVKLLLNVEQTRRREEHFDMFKAYVIEALDSLYDQTSSQAEVMAFVKAEMASTSAKTAKLAKAFVKKRG